VPLGTKFVDSETRHTWRDTEEDQNALNLRSHQGLPLYRQYRQARSHTERFELVEGGYDTKNDTNFLSRRLPVPKAPEGGSRRHVKRVLTQQSRQPGECHQEAENFDDLDVAMGGKANAQKLTSRLEDELEHQQKMQSRYSAAQKAVKYGAIGIGLGELSNIVHELLGH
jgi:hypothetical protein